MIKNYFATAWRNIRKHPVFSLVNITGLTVGLAAFWMIALYIANELSYDRYHTNADRIFRVVHHANWDGGSFKLAPTSVPFAEALKRDYPAIKETVRFDPEGGGNITAGDKNLKADDILFTDASVFNIFSYHFLYGDPKTALAAPQQIVLTRSLAEKLFGTAEAAVNKTLYFNKTFPNTVTAVIDDVPVNSHFSFSALRSFPADYTDGWQNFYVYTYILLNKGTDYKTLETQLPQFYDRYLKTAMGKVNYRMDLQPLTSIHLHSNLDYEMAANGDIKYVYIFSIVALLIVFIAVINYVNLSTARSSVRVKEIGVRKVIGSGKTQLVFLFLAESILLSAISAALAGVIVQMVLPWFSAITGKELNLWQFGVNRTIGSLVLFTLVTGLLTGLYPAFFLSGFKAIPALKGQMGKQGSTVLFRKTLVTFQFVTTIILIAASGIIYRQIQFTLKKDLGFNKNQVLTFHIDDQRVREQVPAIKQELLKNPLIEAVSAASNPIGNNNIGSNGLNFEQESSKSRPEAGRIDPSARMVQNFMVDEDYINTLQIKLSQGRNFSTAIPSDKLRSLLINETLVKELGWKHPVGKKVQMRIPNKPAPVEAVVIGVVKDFNIYSLQHKIEPLVLSMPPVAREEDNLYIRISQNNIPAALQYIKDTYKKFDADNTIQYAFLDENFAKQYQSEEKQGRIIVSFTVLAVLISCLGLLGLVTFTASQRTREIGIRKTLGAGVSDIVLLLSRDLVKLVLLAIVIATPIAYYVMHSWLQSFAYRVSIGWGIFVLAGGLALLAALLTLGIQTVRAALANPVASLRSE
jgi:putative ABC transport system permease protein